MGCVISGWTVKQDARYTLLLESVTEINARLRVLDEANARLEAAVERQLELLEILTTRQTQVIQQNLAGSGSQTDSGSQSVGTRANLIVDDDHEYSRDTHPALFRVVDLLEQDERARTLSVRQLVQETGVSKSWCAIAKRHVLREKTFH
jgi:hypothetical protein